MAAEYGRRPTGGPARRWDRWARGQTRPVPACVIVDGNNVIGAVPDGWWRDRPAAARRLLGRLQCLVGAEDLAVVLVLDVADPTMPEGDHGGVDVRYARRRGRDAADDRIRELVAERAGGTERRAEPLTVITSDRALADDVRAAAVDVIGATAFLGRLDERGC